jgi:23S rRNA pseudouridine1911/1915/1917 synthase
MTARRRTGRAALTEYRVLRRLSGYTLLEVAIHTGRTHQIRVHLSNLGHPVVGDTLYGARGGMLDRNFLHAFRIRFRHPRSGERMDISAPLPAELQAFLNAL